MLSNQADSLYVNNLNIQFEIPASSNAGHTELIKLNKSIYPYDSLIKLKHATVILNYNTNTLRALDLEVPFLSNVYNANDNTSRLTVPLPYLSYQINHQLTGGISYLCPLNKIDTDFELKVYRCFADGVSGTLTGAGQTMWINLEFEIYSNHQY